MKGIIQQLSIAIQHRRLIVEYGKNKIVYYKDLITMISILKKLKDDE